MGNITKLTIILLIAVLAASSLSWTQALSVEDIPKPSPPEFTVQIVAHPYDVPPETTTKIDQYTGKETTTTQAGYRVENKSIEIRIKNPSFTPITVTEFSYWSEKQQKTCTVECNYIADLYYGVRVKGHFGVDWQTSYSISVDWQTPQSLSYGKAQLDAEYTVLTIGADYPNDAVLDFQVQAGIGYYLPINRMIYTIGYEFYGRIGDWSNTQILEMGEVGATAVPAKNQPMPTPTTQQTATPTPSQQASTPTQNPPTQTPTAISLLINTMLKIFAVATIVALLLAVSLIIIKKRRWKNDDIIPRAIIQQIIAPISSTHIRTKIRLRGIGDCGRATKQM